MRLRYGRVEDLKALAEIEKECFPAQEVIPEEVYCERLQILPDQFWILEEDGEIAGFIHAMASDEEHIQDSLYHNLEMYREDGDWLMILSVDTPERYRRRGHAAKLLERVIDDAGKKGKKGLVLACKESLIPFYEKFGFVNEGISQSVFGGVQWYEMRLRYQT